MTRYSNTIFSILLWFFGGTLYFLIEVAYKTITGHPERISWTMLIVALLLTIPIERCGYELPWSCPLLLQALVCSVLVTFVELITGLFINVWLGWNVWDYSSLPLNLWGQICLQYSVAWYGLCLIFIPVFDWIRWAVLGGEKPKYHV